MTSKRRWRWGLAIVGLAVSTLIAGCGCAAAPPPGVPSPPTCLNNRSATILLQREGRPDSYRQMTLEGVHCQGDWAVGTLVAGDDGFGSAAFKVNNGRWNYLYGAGSFRSFCEVTRRNGAPAWVLEDCYFG